MDLKGNVMFDLICVHLGDKMVVPKFTKMAKNKGKTILVVQK